MSAARENFCSDTSLEHLLTLKKIIRNAQTKGGMPYTSDAALTYMLFTRFVSRLKIRRRRYLPFVSKSSQNPAFQF